MRSSVPSLKITPDHPRLWITPDRLPAFRRDAKTFRRPYRDSLLAALEPLITDAHTVRKALEEQPDAYALALGEAWRITADRKYAQAALWALEGLWRVPTEIRHDYDVWGATAETAALLYDWFHDYWQATGQTRRIAEAVAFCTRQALDYFLNVYIVDDWHNYALGLQAGVLAGALALGNDFPDLQRFEQSTLLKIIHAMHFTGFPYARTRLQDVYTTPATRLCLADHLRSFDGVGFCAHQEATGGYHLVDSYEFIKMADYWTTGLQSARPAARATSRPPVWPEMERVGEALLQFLRPDLQNCTWGDSRPWPTQLTGASTILYHLNARHISHHNAVFTAYLQAFGKPRHFARATHALLCATPAIAAAHRKPAALDRTALAGWPVSTWLNPLAILRSGWDKDATHLTFRIGRHGGGHNHFDHNSFTLYRGGPLAVDSGWTDYIHRSRTEYSIRTLAHNSLLVRNPREKSWIGRHGVPTQNDGGQRLATYSYSPPNIDTGNPHAILTEERRQKFHDEFEMGRLVAKEFHAEFDYLAGDATRAYTYPWSGVGTNPSRRVEEFVRQVVFLKPDLIVIFDRVEATRADYEKIWLLHMQGDPVTFRSGGPRGTVAKNGFHPKPGRRALPAHAIVQTECDRGRMTLWPLLPQAQSLRAIGGKGFETWIEHPVAPDPAGGVNFTPTGDSKEHSEAGRWRIELRPTAQAKRQHFLTVLHAGLTREAPARDRFTFAVEESAKTVTLTVRDAQTGSSAPTLTFNTHGPVSLGLTLAGAEYLYRAPAPERVPLFRKSAKTKR